LPSFAVFGVIVRTRRRGKNGGGKGLEGKGMRRGWKGEVREERRRWE